MTPFTVWYTYIIYFSEIKTLLPFELRDERNQVRTTDKMADLLLKVVWEAVVYLNQPSQNLKDVSSDKV